MRIALVLGAVGVASNLSAAAADLRVDVTGVTRAAGEIGCALFAGPKGFPKDESVRARVWVAADPRGTACVFHDLAPGDYAVAVSLDENGNRRLDTNLVGMPREAWGVSNGARPMFRAPRFDEARVSVGTEDVTIKVEVKR
jgi:uncharacterized protein (DUF2141 family)